MAELILNTPLQVIIMAEIERWLSGGTMNGENGNSEKLIGDLKTLVTDAEELLKATASQAGEKIAVARQKIEQSLVEGKKALADAEQTLFKKSKECAEIADDYVRENPWSAVGIAAPLGGHELLSLLIRYAYCVD